MSKWICGGFFSKLKAKQNEVTRKMPGLSYTDSLVLAAVLLARRDVVERTSTFAVGAKPAKVAPAKKKRAPKKAKKPRPTESTGRRRR